MHKDAKPESIISMLQGLTPAETKKWLQAATIKIKVEAGCLIWLPPAHLPWVFGIDSEQSYGYYQPVMSLELLHKLPINVRDELKSYFAGALTSLKKQEPWTTMAPTIDRFLTGL